MKTWLIEFTYDGAECSDFLTLKADDEKTAIEKFNSKKPIAWKFVSVKQIWIME